MTSPSRSQRAGQMRVLIVGTGLIGTSVGLALRGRATVELADRDARALDVAVRRGAGEPASGKAPDLVVVAVPPAAVPAEVLRLQHSFPSAVVTDVSSAQCAVRQQAAELGCDLSRFVGGHPLAGRERGGPESALEDLFVGRPWVVIDDAPSAPAQSTVLQMVELLEARPVTMTAEQHDDAMALVSHAPHVVAAALAGLLCEAPESTVALAGRGMGDTVRIAGAPTPLWLDILSANAAPVADVLDVVCAELSIASGAWRALAAGELAAAERLAAVMHRGRLGHGRLESSAGLS